MALFGFLKKKREEELPLPPPPSPPEMQPFLKGDIEQIRAPPMPSREMQFEEHEEPPLPQFPPALPAPDQQWKTMEAPASEKEVVYDKTVQIQEERIERPEVIRAIPKPTFVAVEDYKRIINDTNTIRSKLMDAENFVRKLSDIKNEEEKSFERWRTQLEDVEKKLNYVDQLIAKAQG